MFVFSAVSQAQNAIETPKHNINAVTLVGQLTAVCFEEVPIEAVLIVQAITGGTTAYPGHTTCESLGASFFVGILADALGVNIYSPSAEFPTALCLLTKVICQSGPYQEPVKTQVVEYHHARLNHYFRTADTAEIKALDSGAGGGGWLRTGDNFPALAAGTGIGFDVCRFYTAGANSHFYTADRTECSHLKKPNTGWQYEGQSFRANLPILSICPGSGKEVYRLYNNRAAQKDSNHRFTTSYPQVTLMALQGWKLEGVAFCTIP
jgi:Repeat of unknown function (DUF5648)